MGQQSTLGFSVVREISRTRRALIYQGRDSDERPVVIKVMRETSPPPDRVAWFRREYDLLRRLEGVAGVPVARMFGRDDDRWTMVIDDIGGLSVAVVARERALGLDEALRVIEETALILGRVHERGIVHRDVKPSNIVFNRATGQVELIDFGAASLLDREDAQFDTPTSHEGTLAYMSPEQTGRMNRSVDYRSDLYSLGATLYEVLTGSAPFSTVDPMELVHAHLARVPVAPSERNESVPRVLSDITMRLLAKDADDRYPSAEGVAADLTECRSRLRETGEIAPFPIARSRRPTRFVLPQRLYGREREVRALTEAFEAAANGGEQLALIAGYAGVGKTAVVQELFKPLTERRGFFISGKFDQLRSDSPFEPLVDALRALARQLLGESEAELESWKLKLREALGDNAQVLIDVIPELGLVLGPQPPAPSLPGPEAQGRFEHLLGLFVAVFARAEHPLAIFLDDLQWVDPASLRLIENVLLRPEGWRLLVIGAYRDNEVAPGSPLLLARDRLRHGGTTIHEITLNALGPESVQQFLCDALESTPDAIAPLCEVVTAKTRGNPFFMRAFLVALHREGLLRAQATWTWDLAAIRARDITDNVVALMTSRIRTLPAETCAALAIAGALGSGFDLRSLAVASGVHAATAWRRLWPAVAEGFVLPLDSAYQILATDPADDTEEARLIADSVELRCRFAHDRVQEAAYASVDAAARPALHWNIGQRMLAAWGDAPSLAQLFDTVAHLNVGRALAPDEAMRDRLAALNLDASRRAKSSAAFSAAHAHASIGLELLGAEGLTRRYGLSMELLGDAAETAYQTGDFDLMEALCARGFAAARRPLDAAWLHEVRTEALNGQGRPLDALHHALDYLDALGVRCPRAPTMADVGSALAATEAMLADRTLDELAAMPDITDPAIRTAITLICKVYSSAYVASPLVFVAVALRQMQLVVEHGNLPVSSLVYAVYGLLLAGVAGNVERGYEFGRLSDRLLERPDVARYRAQAVHLFNCHTRFWREHVRASADGERQAWRVGLDTGEVEFGSYGGHVASKYAFFLGQDLVSLVAEMQHYTLAMRRMRSDIALHSHLPWHQAALNLSRPCEEPWRLRGPIYDDEAMRPGLVASNDRMSCSNALTARLILSVLFERFGEALALAREGAAVLDSVLSQFNQPVHRFFAGLAALGALDSMEGEERAEALRSAEASLKQLQRWALSAPVNFAHKVALLEAELLRVKGDTRGARDRYDDAITMCQANGFVLDEAVACEAAARFLNACGQRLPARHYLRDARDAYVRWGATTRVAALEERYADALPSTAAESAGVTRSTRTTGLRGEAFDVASVIRASQALSREVHLPDLLRALVQAVMSNAGAERAVLLLERGGQLVVEADARVGDATIEVLRSIPLTSDGPSALPESVIKYAVRSREPVVLEDARSAQSFASDPYIRAAAPRSVLCQPVLGAGQVKGAIYLENNLTAGAFTVARCDVVSLLAGQMAIAVDNARHYATLEQRVRERTSQLEARNRFIRQVFGRYLSDDVVDALLTSEEGANIGGARRTVTVMFTDLRGFTSICERFAPERVTAMLNNYLGVMTRLIHKHHGIIDDILGDGMLVIFGAPLHLDDHPAHAVACSLEMQLAMREVNTWNEAQSMPAVAMGVGIHTGDVVVGSIGSELRAKYGAVGRNVNLGARIESITAAGQVLISEATRKAIPYGLRIDGERSFTPKGSTEPVAVFHVGAIEGPYAVALPRPEERQPLASPISAELRLIEGKEMLDERHVATVISVSASTAELRSLLRLTPGAPLRLDVPSGEGHELIYARVLSAEDDRVVVQFDQGARVAALVHQGVRVE